MARLQSCAEFGSEDLPGVQRIGSIFPNPPFIEVLIDVGMNILRIPIIMERIAQGTMTSALEIDYLAGLTTVVDYITSAGRHAILDAHNYGRYGGIIFTSTSDSQKFLCKVALESSSNESIPKLSPGKWPNRILF